MSKVLLCALLVVSLVSTGSSAAGRRVGMEIGMPNGSMAKLAVSDGSMVPIDVAQVGRFGFQPMIDPIATQWVTVAVFSLKGENATELGEVKVFVGNKATASDTSPSFQIRVIRIE